MYEKMGVPILLLLRFLTKFYADIFYSTYFFEIKKYFFLLLKHNCLFKPPVLVNEPTYLVR